MHTIGQWKIICDDQTPLSLASQIINHHYKIIKTFKDDKRSKVMLIDIDGQQYVYKEPIEKNKRKWQQFINIFRNSDSFRAYRSMQKVNTLGLKGPQPIMALQKNRYCSESCLIMEHIDASMVQKELYPKIIQILHDIHQKGYLHGDTNLCNFLEKDKDIYLIDCALKKNRFGVFGKAYEFVYMSDDMDNYQVLFGDMIHQLPYRIVIQYRAFYHFTRRVKKFLRGK